MSTPPKPEPCLHAIPAEMLEVIVRHAFRGEVIQIGNPSILSNPEGLAWVSTSTSILGTKEII
jgi:hypothetical protein